MSKILTIQQAQEFFLNARKVITISVTIGEKEVVLFSDDHCIKEYVGAEDWTPITQYFPIGERHVSPRKGLEDGVIRNIQDFIKVFLSKEQIIETEQELIDWIVSINPLMTEVYRPDTRTQ